MMFALGPPKCRFGFPTKHCKAFSQKRKQLSQPNKKKKQLQQVLRLHRGRVKTYRPLSANIRGTSRNQWNSFHSHSQHGVFLSHLSEFVHIGGGVGSGENCTYENSKFFFVWQGR